MPKQYTEGYQAFTIGLMLYDKTDGTSNWKNWCDVMLTNFEV